MAGEQLFINRPLPGAQINHSHPLAKGLVGCWLMNEQAGIRCVDSSPYGNHGTMVGFGVPANSRSSQGIKLDGVDDYINCGASMSLDVPTSFTISAWIKSANNNRQVILSKGQPFDGLTNYGYEMTYRGDVADYPVYLSINGVGGDNVYTLSYNTLGAFSGVWKNVVGSYDTQTNISKIYINSVLVAAGTAPETNYTTTNPLLIGNTTNKTNRFFSGSIDDVRIYNRTLNKDEVKELYLNPYAMFKR